MSTDLMLFIGFNLMVLVLLAIDLGFFHKESHEIKVKEALISSAVWISLALLFNIGVYYFRGSEAGLAFLTGYLIEKSLSVDNIFVFVMVFAYFKVPLKYQYKILFWGIIGALIMRATMIVAGTALIQNFHWTLYIFGALLLITGIKMFTQKEDEKLEPENNPVVKLFKKFMPVTNEMNDDKFFVRKNGMLMATPLFIVLIVIETTDLIFAVDSIPAIFGVTQDPFIVYTSNVFAILGLRALYFALAGIIDQFHYLKYGLSLILVFIGTKMLIAEYYKIPILLALAVVLAILIVSVIVSLLKPPVHIENPATESDTEKALK